MVEASSLKKGDFVVLNEEPFLVEKAQSVVIGRHSHTKMKIDLLNMFSNEKRALSAASGEEFEKVDVIRKHGQFVSKIGDRTGQVMDMKDYSVCEAELSEGLDINEGDEVTYIEFKSRAKVIDKRE